MASVVKKRREDAAQSFDAGDAKKCRQNFSKFDFTAMVIEKALKTPAAVMSHVQDKGSLGMQAFVNKHQGHLDDFIKQSWEWANAKTAHVEDAETGWDRVQRLASGKQKCACGAEGCKWWAAAHAFFDRNRDTICKLRLAACLAAVLDKGPSKTRRIPLIVGPTNAAKSTIFDPLDEVFGEEYVTHTPMLGASMPLANLALKKKRFMYLDVFSRWSMRQILPQSRLSRR
jgi:hypothetical protein